MNKKLAEFEERKRCLRDELATQAISIVRAALDFQLLPGPAQIEIFRALSADYEKAQQDYMRELYSCDDADREDRT